MKMLTMLGVTFLLSIMTTFSLIGSAYYSDKNYKLGKFLYKASLVTGGFYTLSALAVLGMGVNQVLEFLF